MMQPRDFLLPVLLFLICFILFRTYCKRFFSELSRYDAFVLFVGKVTGGFLLILIYSYFYTDRKTADVFKYFDDACILAEAFYNKPLDYFKMLFGWNNDTPYFDKNYYSKMHNWYRNYAAVYNDNHSIIRFNAMLIPITGGNIYANSVVMSFLSSLGIIQVYSFFSQGFKQQKKYLFILAFFPSILLWTSGLLKEGLLVTSSGILFYGLSKATFNFKNVVAILLGIFLLVSVKIYFLATLFPSFIALLLLRKYTSKTPIFWFAVTYILTISMFLILNSSNVGFKPLNDIASKQREFLQLAKGGLYIQLSNAGQSDTFYINSGNYLAFKNTFNSGQLLLPDSLEQFTNGKLSPPKKSPVVDSLAKIRVLLDLGITGSGLSMQPLQPTISQFIKASPQAFFNILFQPTTPFGNAFMSLAFVENIVLLLATLFVFYQLIYYRLFSSWIKDSYVLFALFSSIALFWIVGISTPIVGALVRYKVPAVMLWLGMLIRSIMLVNQNVRKQGYQAHDE